MALIEIHSENPQERKIKQVVDCLRKGGVIIYPTDTVYGIGCDIMNSKAIERICKIKEVKPKEAKFSFICENLSHISDYARQFNNTTFKAMKRALPGPFTFILNAGSNVPKLLQSKRKSVGVRVLDNNIAQEIIKGLGNPIISTSLKDKDEVIEYMTNPELIHEDYRDLVDIVIDGGIGNNVPSTVVDCTSGEVELVREGLGDVNLVL